LNWASERHHGVTTTLMTTLMTTPGTQPEHRVLRLWIRPMAGRPMTEVQSLEVEAGRGIVGDHAHGRLRHVTVVFAEDWAEATRRLGRDVDAAARRANVLVSGAGGARYARCQLLLGDVLLQMKGPVTPCPVMDRAALGLMDALREGDLAGVWGRAVSGGAIRIGDALGIASDQRR
jgi:MOSC domain-containing protein YiiM